MRFSAATMAILALSADWATAARINGVIRDEPEYQLTKNRELNPKASKKAKEASKAASKKTKEAFSCGVSGTSSKSSKKSTSDDDSCDTPTSVECYGRYKGTVTLTTGLVCFLADEGRTFGIIMDGPAAVLDCAGNDVVVDGVDGVVDNVLVYSAAIVLRNGATAMNCQVHSGEGNGFGVWIDEGDATLIDSDIYNKFLGVFISGDGCRTLTNVRTSGNGEAGVIIVNATDTIVMTNLEANGNDYGVAVVPAGEGETVDLFMDGAKLNSNGRWGLVVDDNAGNATIVMTNLEANGNGDHGVSVIRVGGPPVYLGGTVNLVMDGAKLNSNGNGLFVEGNGNVDVELFGTVRAIGNEVYGIATAIGNRGEGIDRGDGIVMSGASTLTVNGKLQASSNEIGIYLEGDESELVIAESGTVIACGNGEDIDDDSIDQIIKEDGYTLIYEVDACAASAPPNKVAECELELEASLA